MIVSVSKMVEIRGGIFFILFFIIEEFFIRIVNEFVGVIVIYFFFRVSVRLK